MFGAPEYVYHQESPFGRDIYDNGKSIGIGSVAALVDGNVVRVADVAERNWRIVGSGAGPVRAIVEIEYKGWKVGGRSVDLTSRFTQWAGEHGFEHRITVSGADGLQLVTGLPKKANVELLRPEGKGISRHVGPSGGDVRHQGPERGPARRESRPGAVRQRASRIDDPANHLVSVTPQNGQAHWYVAAMWDQEGSETPERPSEAARW